jgi:hypothetical protein
MPRAHQEGGDDCDLSDPVTCQRRVLFQGATDMNRRISAWLVAAALAVVLVPTSASAQFDSLFNTLLQGGANSGSGNSSSGSPAPSGDATAQVTSISGATDAGVETGDSVYSGQTIDLGSSGRLVLAYAGGCSIETIRGGVVTVGAGASRVSGGLVSTSRSASCGRSQVALNANSSEAGAGVDRVVAVNARSAEAGAGINRLGETPFDPRLWAETTVSSGRPQFSGADGSIRIVMLDAPSPQTVWEGQGGAGFRYPGDAPKLQTGVPYRIEAGGHSAVFSVDPGVKGAGSMVVLR